MTHFSLCSGIGGIDLAAEWAVFETVGQCEIADYPYGVLEKHFPNVPKWRDIRDVTAKSLQHGNIGEITVLSAGFPCQPYSLAGKGKGDGDERDLWGELTRCIGELSPKWFVGENTPGLLQRDNGRFFKRILYDLAELGYMVSWGMWGACHVGGYHKRLRVFIIAHSAGIGWSVMDENSKKRCADLPIQMYQKQEMSDAFKRAFDVSRLRYPPNSGVLRNDNGLSKGVDRLRCLGNAVMPHQIYPIFKAIAEIERNRF